jgi:hypothetical protein
MAGAIAAAAAAPARAVIGVGYSKFDTPNENKIPKFGELPLFSDLLLSLCFLSDSRLVFNS